MSKMDVSLLKEFKEAFRNIRKSANWAYFESELFELERKLLGWVVLQRPLSL